MAISKTQNERPAIIELIDTSNTTESIVAQNVQDIATLTEGLSDEVRDRESADTLLDGAIRDEVEARAQAIQGEAELRAQAVQGLQTQIGNGFTQTSVTQSLGATNQQVLLLGTEQTALAEDVSGILSMLENVKFGVTVDVTVPANDSYAGSYVYSEPFDSNSKSFVMLGFADGPLPSTLSLDLIDSSYSGFSYSITNTDTDPATVAVGYLAIAAIPLS